MYWLDSHEGEWAMSVLLKFTKSEFANSYLKGDLYLSSLTCYTNMKTVGNGVNGQYDFSEGLAASVPKNILDSILKERPFEDYIMHDVRFRVKAYDYCNLLCFYRIDTFSTVVPIYVNKSYPYRVKNNPVLSPQLTHVVQVPDNKMKSFGDIVIIIKDEETFTKRVLAAIEKAGGECVIGDIRYHDIQDRLEPAKIGGHNISLISDQEYLLANILTGRNDVIRYGCLDKYSKYAHQKEWRICWLPSINNHEAKWLRVGDLSDIIEIVSSKKIEDKLVDLYPGYYLGQTNECRTRCSGTVTYPKFKRIVESIDGKCQIMFEIG
jgi:hypothetical protein